MSKPAVVAVIHREGRFLMIKRADGLMAPGYWVPPSGRVEEGESFEEALVREMKEELGLAVRPGRELWTCPTEDGSMMLHWWQVEVDLCEPMPDPAEVAELRWCTVEEIKQLSPVFADDVRFFAEIWLRVRG